MLEAWVGYLFERGSGIIMRERDSEAFGVLYI